MSHDKGNSNEIKENGVYIVEMPLEEEENLSNLALVPFNINAAMENLSLKRKLEKFDNTIDKYI